MLKHTPCIAHAMVCPQVHLVGAPVGEMQYPLILLLSPVAQVKRAWQGVLAPLEHYRFSTQFRQGIATQHCLGGDDFCSELGSVNYIQLIHHFYQHASLFARLRDGDGSGRKMIDFVSPPFQHPKLGAVDAPVNRQTTILLFRFFPAHILFYPPEVQ